MRYAYLGPSGTFTEAALHTLPDAAESEQLPYATVPAALDAVRRGEADAAVVALENSVEGSVPTTLDELATGEQLQIVAEVNLPVEFALLVRPGTSFSDVKTVASHPHAHPQCRRWLAEHVPDAEWRAATSNAEAAQHVATTTRRWRVRSPRRAMASNRWPPTSTTSPTPSPGSWCCAGRARRPSRPTRTVRPWSPSSARTTLARCWRS
jgi:prephenate dehydratase